MQRTCADGGFVLVGELLIDILVHEGSFADAGITQNDDFQEGFSSRHDGAEGGRENEEERSTRVTEGHRRSPRFIERRVCSYH